MDKPKYSVYEGVLFHSRADRILRNLIARELEKYHVSMMEYLTLGAIDQHGSPMTMSGVAAALDVSLPQVTALMADLLQLKLVKQKTMVQDRRSRLVTVTPKGKRLLTDVEVTALPTLLEQLKAIPLSELNHYGDIVKMIGETELKPTK
jgi:DNA-binding MarR family transcriptional regulator